MYGFFKERKEKAEDEQLVACRICGKEKPKSRLCPYCQEEEDIATNLIYRLQEKRIPFELMDEKLRRLYENKYRIFSEWSSIGCFKIHRQNFDILEVIRFQAVGEKAEILPAYYYLNFIVKTSVKGHKKQLEVKTKVKKEEAIPGKVSDIGWEGGELADILNRDTKLKEALLNKPSYFEIRLESKKEIVRIGSFNMKKLDYDYIEVFNRISAHIRNMLSLPIPKPIL